MRLLAIGDIHGCSRALDCLLDVINLRKTDKIVTLGDYINKGPDSKGVIERLIKLYQQGQLIPLRGNHEIELIRAKRENLYPSIWLNSRIKETLLSYGVDYFQGWQVIPPQHWEFLERICLDSWENEDFIFVHANLHPLLSLSQQPDYYLFWEKCKDPFPHYSGKTMICGHNSQKNGQPLNFGHAVCLDTWACGEGWLTGLDVNTGQIWQTNQKKQVKTSHINDYRVKAIDYQLAAIS